MIVQLAVTRIKFCVLTRSALLRQVFEPLPKRFDLELKHFLPLSFDKGKSEATSAGVTERTSVTDKQTKRSNEWLSFISIDGAESIITAEYGRTTLALPSLSDLLLHYRQL
ncbi:hypothetical protein J6590_090095 [Homalodisca vitripennis]|nr:hypothetical protein J6590_090095 [Homalodisca vitripennis]